MRGFELLVPPLETDSVFLGMCETQDWYPGLQETLSLNSVPFQLQPSRSTLYYRTNIGDQEQTGTLF